MYNISIIAAMDQKWGIGRGDKLPWPNLKADMDWFRNKTMNKPVILGRKTYESIGRPLKNRTMIVVTSQPIFAPDVFWAISPEQAIDYGKVHADMLKTNEIMILGGGQIYQSMMKYCNRIYLTAIDHTFQADTFFPEIVNDQWRLESEQVKLDDPTGLTLHFLEFQRIADGIPQSVRTPTICLDKGPLQV